MKTNTIYNEFINKVNNTNLSAVSYTDEDDLHTQAHALFHNIADEISNECGINSDDCCDGEEWYDEFYDDIFLYILEQMVK